MQKTVLLCVTGCIAAYKSCEIARALQKAGVRVKVCMTEHATSFVGPTTFRALTREEVAVDLFDNPSDPIHHISLAKEPDVVLVAPATANVVAKVAHGQADDLLTTTVLATDAPVVVAPAMNVGMWQAEATQKNIATLEQRGFDIVRPATGYLACGDTGEGKLADVDDIVARTLVALKTSQALAGERVLITAGGTREAIDPVRYIGNRSSGKMGHALARAARAMGAEVTLVTASTQLSIPFGVEGVRVESAAQMLDAVSQRFDACTMLICAAAVADYAPAHPASHKLSKADGELTHIDLVKTADILAEMSRVKGNRVVIGFAAETNDLVRRARAKLERKGCDAIVANDVSRAESTFGSDTNAVTWVSSQGVEELPCTGKQALAFELLRRAVALKS
ncbi:bifunctional phosphopantothenoylcysteine decarboxylase/phosphopantothenate--cysteine ligase CoaBC [Collinsella stercoris]|uniref:Coenzyme A biosynthesis bifunctional protein CoaBC n=1 Tax=Collinsella stercoris DSM 13279 TaxID=445975 RepID=B6GBW1_9ACTN|nr:bifunctional phosphopantothenoylcysteine decarboxylase/phosphopantothenate--cysteine ligase CoaBC [Collinsella stercoris]EEA90225.1 phosphopantothenoylcysteine decarboxylase/phosphopantothenate--cysteine ligase [Collinsella stercoris DSM 13279]UEA46156.1 bifunctional phosphopantothenoylcysteine decarboxylase/phosphopantothenate--cysteine ligase CoaBC [Collinsella stercoris DSM 13279]UWP11327.1 bifunctional phosphopantothenoylcysteine decarboxylase/phosphopantothenate--cysteine ligase CoaBC [C